jgi:hypothetical protein
MIIVPFSITFKIPTCSSIFIEAYAVQKQDTIIESHANNQEDVLKIIMEVKEITSKYEKENKKQYPDNAIYIACLIITLLGCLFWLVFKWSQRNEQASYLGGIYRDTIFEYEFNRKKSYLEKKRYNEEYEQKAISLDPWLKDNRYTIERPDFPVELRKYIQTGTGTGRSIDMSRRPHSNVPGLDDDIYSNNDPVLIHIDKIENKNDRDKYNDYTKAYNDFKEKKLKWTHRLRERVETLYIEDIEKARKDAEKKAKAAADIDISIFRGRGPTFVLEFTAIVVIIFSSVILGVLDILKSDQIGTLLAAIAGYVLGRSTSHETGKEQRDKEQRDKEQRDKEQRDKEQRDKEQRDKEQRDKEQRDKEQKN